MESYNRIAPSVVLGEDVFLACYINAYGCEIGARTKIGSFVEIQKNARIGSDCKISSHTFICDGVAIEDGVFIGHGVMFINDRFPRAVNADGSMQTEEDWDVAPTRVGARASIGSNATILCGVEIGEGAMVGAGSVATKSIPPYELWVGNPARFLRKLERPDSPAR